MSDMLFLLEKELNNRGVFEGNFPVILDTLVEAIPNQSFPHRLKLALAVSELMLFTSQFRKNILHWNDSLIPVNSLMFCIAKSGAAKDSTLKALRKCFEPGYSLIEDKRKQFAVEKAIQEARTAGCDLADKYITYKDYFISPNPLFVAVSTVEGFVQHLNDLSEDSVGSGFIYSGEFSSELASNANLLENIKILAELYDEGSKEVKVLKNRENQSKEVRNLPVSALFISSPDNILYNDQVKTRFKTEFTSKMARRSLFIFMNEEVIPPTYASIEHLLKEEKRFEDIANKAKREIQQFIKEQTLFLLNSEKQTLYPSNEVRELFILYKRYNEELAQTIDKQYPMNFLTRCHLQWKALKLSGAFALIDGSFTIQEDHYKAAIEFLEKTSSDILKFEKELTKEPYELFADYCKTYAVDGSFDITLHNLRKCGFITGKTNIDSQMRELVKLVSSFDDKGVYTLKKDLIQYKALNQSEHIILSYVPCTGSKEVRRKRCDKGYVTEKISFAELCHMLEGDYAYTPFSFKNGIRGRDNIESTCKWIVLDIDTTEITDKEAHILLEDINHFVVRTSDKSNPHKFRVLLELDCEVDIPNDLWIPFIQSIAKDLGLIADPVAKAQIFFSYAGREILTQLEATPLPVRDFVQKVMDSSLEKKQKEPSKKAVEGLLADPLNTFHKAYYAKHGERSRRLIVAAHYARDLGATREYVLNLVTEIYDYWIDKWEGNRFENTILKPIRERWVFNE